MPAPTGPVGGSWELVFADDFAGSTLDLNKWQPNWLAAGAADTGITKGVADQEDACVDSALAVVNNGNLEMRVVTNPTTCNAILQPYRSTLVNTFHDFQFTNGFMEARIYLPGTGGHPYNWPSFWSVSTTLESESEVDVIEGLDTVSWNYHFGGSQTGPTQAVGDWTGWHTYGANKKATSIDYWYDGVKIGTVASNVVNDEHFIILQYTINLESAAPPLADGDPMLVDYVRVWGPASYTAGPVTKAQIPPRRRAR